MTGMTESEPKPETRAVAAERRRIEKAERESKALLLRRSGLDYKNIARLLGCSPSTAHSMVHRTLDRLPVESAIDLRRHLLSRLEEVHRSNAAQADVPKHANVILRTVETTARLAGLNLDTGGNNSFVGAQVLIENYVTKELTPQHAGDVIDPNRPAIIINSALIPPPTRIPADDPA